MTALLEHSLAELCRRVQAGELRAREWVEACLARIAEIDGSLHAFLEVRRDQALREAQAADAARDRGAALGPLHGAPLVVKANMVSPDLESGCASRALAGFRAPYECTAIRKLREAGAILLGTSNMDEFAMGSSCENSAFGPTRNPWDPACVPGGSSGGSAAAVAAREAPGALGSDTGGSIRQPAALCGVVGVKPTYGRVSRRGLVAFASSLDQIGPIARSARDAALLLQAIAGHDPGDSTSLPEPVPDYAAALGDSLDGLRIAIPAELLSQAEAAADAARPPHQAPGRAALALACDPQVLAAVRAALEVLRGLGGKISEVSLPYLEHGVAAYYLICTAEASSNLARYDGVQYGYRAEARDLQEMYRRTRSQSFGAEVKRRIMLGTFVLSAGYVDAYYHKAQQVRTLIQRDFERALESCEVIAMPTAPGPAWRIGERVHDPLAMYLSDVYTVPANLAGLPALSVPCGFTDSGLPIGLQLIGRPLGEASLLRVAHAYEQNTPWVRTGAAA
jgi:aspartyl-tRNA(Asn)/glutamyl-tRNA(Gln) amidotransferase subunit A